MSGASAVPGTTRVGFQPTARRRNRIAAGVALAAIAIGGNLLVYSSLDDTEPVVQVVRDVPAGSQLTGDMLRTVEVAVDATVNVVDGDQLDSLVGSYAKVRLVSGALVTAEALQATPLVSSGSAVVAIEVAEGSLPIGLRERSAVQLVIPAGAASGSPDAAAPSAIVGRVVGLPIETSSALGMQSISVEVAADDAIALAAADDVRVVLIEPGNDPAADDVAVEASDPAVDTAGSPDREGTTDTTDTNGETGQGEP
jgi:hypothetical protein